MTKNTYQFIDTPDFIQNTKRFWLIRHAIVSPKDRSYLYGAMDVKLCSEHVRNQKAIYEHLACRLPSNAAWITTSLSRTQDTAQLIQKAGYGHQGFAIDDSFIEQNLGEWQGQPHHDVAQHCQYPTHPYWPFCAKEHPPQGENMYDVLKRVSRKLELLSAQSEEDFIIISHGGPIRAAISYSLKIPLDSALSLSILNLSLTILEKKQNDWRALTINEFPFRN